MKVYILFLTRDITRWFYSAGEGTSTAADSSLRSPQVRTARHLLPSAHSKSTLSILRHIHSATQLKLKYRNVESTNGWPSTWSQRIPITTRPGQRHSWLRGLGGFRQSLSGRDDGEDGFLLNQARKVCFWIHHSSIWCCRSRETGVFLNRPEQGTEQNREALKANRPAPCSNFCISVEAATEITFTFTPAFALKRRLGF